MRKWCVLFVCLVWLFPGGASAEPIQIYIMAGQSNMVGGGFTADLPAEPFNYQLPQQIPFSFDLETGAHVSQGFELLQPNAKPGTFGSELSFGRRIDEATDAPIGIIKVAASGTNLALSWNPDEPIPDRALYPRLIDHITSATSQIGNQGVDYEFAGFLWTQGESDISDEDSAAYSDNLIDFIQHVRTDLNAPELPVYISRLNQYSYLRNRMVIRAEQSKAARADPYVTVFDTDDLELKFDQVHYSSQGQLDLGHAFADAILFGPPPEDFDGDGLVTDNDLNILINHWNLSSPPGETALGDADGDGFVGQSDLMILMSLIPPPPPPLDNGDLTGEGFVGLDDLTILLANWNQNVAYGDVSMGDLNVDGFVGLADLSQLLGQWNTLVQDPANFIPTPEDMDLDGNGSVGAGDIQFMFAEWSFVDDAAPVLPIGTVTDPVASDFNYDGVVDIEDLRYLMVQIPAALRISPADLDGLGFVGTDDLNAVLAEWNSGQGQTPSLHVPEPAAGGLLLLGLSLAGTRRCARNMRRVRL